MTAQNEPLRAPATYPSEMFRPRIPLASSSCRRCSLAAGHGTYRMASAKAVEAQVTLGDALLYRVQIGSSEWASVRHPRRPSVVDLPRSLPLHGIAHDLQLLGRMTDPVDKLAYDAQRLAAPK